MKKCLKSSFFALGLILFCQVGVYAQHISNCQAIPDPVTVKQPDGSTITIVGKGNNIINYTETVDGFTVVKNNKGIYEYAKNLNGDLVPSGIPAHNPNLRNTKENSFLNTSVPSLRYSTEKINELKNEILSLSKAALPGNDNDHDHDGDGDKLFPTKGKRKVLAILIEYPDKKAQYTAQQFKDLLNKPNYNGTGSMRDYYLENSFGKLDLEIDVMGWYMAPNNFATYGRDAGNGATIPLVAKAVDEAEKEGVDFSQYDNDKDGRVDGVIIVHAGPGAEEGAQTQYIWSHRSSLGGAARKYDGVTVSDYMINPETRISGGTRMIGIGVYCHEFGHVMGLPDLYDTNDDNGTSAGLGEWCLMAGGSYLGSENKPGCFSAYCKSWLGWVTPVTISAEGQYTMTPAATDTLIYRINTPNSKEYFLIENKQYVGFDSKLRGKGLAIFHIDDSVLTRKWGWNSVNSDEVRKGIDLEEADGLDHMDKNLNRGDISDLFPGSKNKTDFNDDTYPNSRNYNGKKTNVRIYKITQNADSTISFNFGSAPSASFGTPVTTICQNSQINLTNNSTFATIYNWNFGDGNTDTIQHPTHTFTEPGTYYIKLKVSNALGQQDEDSIKVIVVAKPEAGFEVSGKDLIVNFTNTTKNGKTYTWYWGDGRLSINNQTTFSRSYEKAGTYIIKMIAANENGCKSDTVIQQIQLPLNTTGVEQVNMENYGLTAYPNPFTGIVNIAFTIQKPEQVQIGIYNIMGQRISLLKNGSFGAGEHKITEDLQPLNLNTGIYLIGINVDGKMNYLKMVKN